MDNEIKLTLEAEEPKAPSLTLEGAPALTLDPQQQEQQAKPAVLDETVSPPRSRRWWTTSPRRSTSPTPP